MTTKRTGYPVIDEILETIAPPATDNRAEVEHTPLPFTVGRNDRIESNGRVIADMTFSSHSERRARANAAFIVTACNSYDEDQRRIAELETALTTASNLGLGYQDRIKQLETALRNLVAADNCNYDRDAMRSEGYFDAARRLLDQPERNRADEN